MTTAAKPREWMPRIWEGCDFLAWLRLLARNRFAVGLPYVYIAVVITFVSACHTVLRLIQDVLFADQVRRTPIPQSPLFILGHWRTGTTLLHELLILDDRHSFPTTYECLEPNHFLLTEELFSRWFSFLMPSRRPMDNMAAGWDRPQEDEFALCMMGQPSPYLSIAFPNRPPQDQAALDLEGLSPLKRAAWKRAFLLLLRRITLRNPKRLILKSPTTSSAILTLSSHRRSTCGNRCTRRTACRRRPSPAWRSRSSRPSHTCTRSWRRGASWSIRRASTSCATRSW
jgi:hypothetical protein